MGILSKKPRVSVEEVCRDFYDNGIFHSVIADGAIDVWASSLGTIAKMVSEADSSFSLIDREQFDQEMTAVRMEIFGLAWSRRFGRSTDSWIEQSLFTRKHLQENGRLEVWDTMGEYNQVVARSTATGGPSAVFRNRSRLDLFEEWFRNNIGDRTPTEEDEHRLTCVARALNRLFADINRDDHIAARMLADKLVERVGCTGLNAEACFQLSAIIWGFHEGALTAIKEVRVRS